MKFRLLIFFVVLSSAISADPYIDSILRMYPELKQDTDKIKCLSEMASYYRLIRYDSTVYYAQRVIDYSERVKYDYGIYLGNLSMFWAMNTRGNYPKALELMLRNMARAEQLKSHRDLAIAQCNDYMGLLNMEMGFYSQAMEYSRNAIRMYPACGEIVPGQGSGYSVMATIYLRTGVIDSALWYALKCVETVEKSGIQQHWGSLSYAVLANAYQANGNLPLAEKYYRMGIAMEDKNNNIYLKARFYFNLAGLFRKMNQQDSAIHYATASLDLSQEYNYANYAMDASLVLAGLYETARKPDSALSYIKVWLAQRDSLLNQQKMQQFNGLIQNEKQRQQEIEAARLNYQNRLRNYGFLSVIAVILLVAIILWRNNIQRRKTNTVLQDQKQELETTLSELKSTQTQLIQSEKMASLGELTAGIAHEIQNPLNFVNNFSEVSVELVSEMKEDMKSGRAEEAMSIAGDIEQNLLKVVHHGKRADAIVKGMLQHSRISSGQKEPADLNALADEYLKLSYHGMRARDKKFNAAISTNLDPAVGSVSIVPQDIGRALLNLFNNAFYYVNEQKLNAGTAYEPTVTLTTKRIAQQVEIRIRDNGPGIPPKILEKIFQPFFTTKPTGEGTGLGLSLTYDIITKEHGGQFRVETREGEYAEFIILL
jgi:two-component system NtrC family sensor kinase